MKVIVTGGARFIGSAVIRQYILQTEHEVVSLDALTYAGNLESLTMVSDHPHYHFEHVDIKNIDALKTVFEKHQPDAVMHLSAESHVDRPGHDVRYAIDASKIERELGWSPKETFKTGLRKTIERYLSNSTWLANVASGAYRPPVTGG